MIDEIASIDELFRMLVHTESDIDLRCYESLECPDTYAFVEPPCAYYAKLLDESFSKRAKRIKASHHEIMKYSRLTAKEAAKSLGISMYHLRLACRHYGYSVWPKRAGKRLKVSQFV
jgi:hypothetical protein